MSASLKFMLGRLGLFVVVGVLLLPTGLDPLVIAMIAVLASFGLSFVVLRRWRTEMIKDMDAGFKRRREQKAALRAELAGEDE